MGKHLARFLLTIDECSLWQQSPDIFFKFGNLVSPIWWNDIWLNEGFATWVEYLGMNFTHPEWKDLDYFYVQKLTVMEKDSLETSRALSHPVSSPSEISAMFDTITYDKVT